MPSLQIAAGGGRLCFDPPLCRAPATRHPRPRRERRPPSTRATPQGVTTLNLLTSLVPAACLFVSQAALADSASAPQAAPPQTTASATDIATTPPAARPGAIISAEALRARYASLTAFRATVEQEKTARFLARPLKSEVEIEMKDGRIDWRSTRPVKSKRPKFVGTLVFLFLVMLPKTVGGILKKESKIV